MCFERASRLAQPNFVHRDVRWPNLVCNGRADWFLIDFALADVCGAQLPANSINMDFLPLELHSEGSVYTTSEDMWQVGKLMTDCGLLLSTSASLLAATLTGVRSERLTAAGALNSDWMAEL